MKLGEIRIDDWNLIISINIIIAIFIIATIIALIVVKIILNKKKKNIPFKVKEYSITVGGQTITIECDYMDREIAYQSWVEMNTRKIGLPIDEENDVIVEVYNSWYKFFGVIRENIKNMPGHKIDCSVELIEKLTDILNSSLREHLTKWQAKFRRWYEIAIDEDGFAEIMTSAS